MTREVLVCMRKAEAPAFTVPSLDGYKCTTCNQPVLITPASGAMLARKRGQMLILCNQCLDEYDWAGDRPDVN